MSGDLDERRESLLEKDWGELWDSLERTDPVAPANRKTSQVTLRLAPATVAGLRRIAREKGLAYHALARSFLLEGLRNGAIPPHEYDLKDQLAPATDQLNIKIDPADLESLKRFSHEAKQPYHRLARHWIVAALEAAAAVTTSSQQSPPPLRDLMLLLLHSSPRGSGHDAIHGLTRLQKLLFLVEQGLAPDRTSFYAHNFGPFDPRVNDALDALRMRGVLEGFTATGGAPSFEEVMAQAAERSGVPPYSSDVFRLNAKGHELAERLRKSNDAYANIFSYVLRLREEYDRGELLERVYDEHPEFTEHSVIKPEIEARNRQRRRRRTL